jgi:hypothetical protein
MERVTLSEANNLRSDPSCSEDYAVGPGYVSLPLFAWMNMMKIEKKYC